MDNRRGAYLARRAESEKARKRRKARKARRRKHLRELPGYTDREIAASERALASRKGKRQSLAASRWAPPSKVPGVNIGVEYSDTRKGIEKAPHERDWERGREHNENARRWANGVKAPEFDGVDKRPLNHPESTGGAVKAARVKSYAVDEDTRTAAWWPKGT